ncbi:MAG: RyR domain-containing protein [Tepidamorphaceae bacterium]
MKVQQQPEGTIRVIATVIAIATLVCGSIGWALKFGVSLETLPVIVVRTIWLFIPRPEVMSDPANNAVLKAGATLGALSGGVGAFAIWMAAANAKLSHLLTRFVRRGHTLVIGNTPLAFRLVRALKSENAVPVHVTDALVLRQERKTDDLRMTLDLTPETLARKAGLLRASSVVIDMGNDADTMVTAKPILRWLERNGPGTVRHMTVRIADPFLADMFLEFSQKIGLGKLVRVSAFDENRVAARHALSSQPLFVRAAARGQSRVHALIVGFGDFGEKLFDQIMLTSIAGDLEQPRVTIVDKDAGRLQREFATRRPGVCESLDVSFIEMDIGAVPLEGAYVGEQVAGLVAAEKKDPLTAIYLTLPTPADNIRAALLLQRHYERNKTLAAPILYRSRGTAGIDGSLLEVTHVADDADHGFIPLPSPDERLARFVLGEADLEKLARKLHENYLKGAEKAEAASRSWNNLPETMRRSNIRAADHLKAKLWTLGIGLPLGEGLPTLSDEDRETLKALRNSKKGGKALVRLARIEHDRWMVDRQLDGWVYGPERDDTRRIHPKLVPFDDLSMTPADIDKDVQQILAAVDHMLEKDAAG